MSVEGHQPPEPESRRPHWVSRVAFFVVVGTFFLSEAALFAAVHAHWYWLAVPLVVLTSHLMHGQLIGFHEASHGLLRRNRILNEIDGVLIGTFSFMSFSLYRASHQTHHLHLGTTRDEEFWPLTDPAVPRWGRALAAFLELNFGLLYSPFIFLRTFLRENTPIRSRKVRRRIWSELALIVVAWSCLLLAVHQFNGWRYFIWMYLAPAILAGNLQSWRKYIEHVGMTGTTVRGITRSIVADGPVGRLIALTLLHEPYHGVHHLRAGVRHWELPQLASDLTPGRAGERPPFESYGRALADLLCSLKNPRLGAEWCDRENDFLPRARCDEPSAQESRGSLVSGQVR